MRSVVVGSSLLAAFIFPMPVFADNPVVQTCYTADPAPLVHNGRVYIFVGHDSTGARDGYLMPDWKCYSSSDMVNWTDHGVVLSPRAFSWATTKDANASQVAYRNGKFYFFASTTASDGVAIGLAVSNSPIGPYKDTLGKPLVSGSQMTGCNATHSWRGLDPTVFIDDDGQAYLYWGNNVCYWVRLNDDMISLKGSISCIPQNDPAFGPDYEEGPWFYKRNSLYYLLYPSKIPESIHYSTSTGPTGPWKYGGEIMPVQQGAGSSSTIHPGVIDFGGKSYFFYHDGSLPGGGSYKRSVRIEEFSYNADGTIPKIPATKDGVKTGVTSLNPFDTTEAETICWESGIRTAPCGEGGIMVDSISNGDYLKVEGVDFADGAKTFEARVASGGSGGTIELRLDSQTGTLVGTCDVKGTGGWDKWETVSCDVTDASGKKDLFLKFTGGNGRLFNFNWWRFTPVATDAAVSIPTKAEGRETIKVRMAAGRPSLLRLDFPQPVSQVNVGLFDLTGRLISTLFTGKVSSPHRMFQLDLSEVRHGLYVINVSLDGNAALTETITVR